MFRGRANVVKTILSTRACRRAQRIENCWFCGRRGTSDKITSKSGPHAPEQIWEMPKEMTTWQNLNYIFCDTQYKPSTCLRCRDFDPSYEKLNSLFATYIRKLNVFFSEVKRRLRKRNDNGVTILLIDFRWIYVNENKEILNWTFSFNKIIKNRFSTNRLYGSHDDAKMPKIQPKEPSWVLSATTENREPKIARNINAKDVSRRCHRHRRRHIHVN